MVYYGIPFCSSTYFYGSSVCSCFFYFDPLVLLYLLQLTLTYCTERVRARGLVHVKPTCQPTPLIYFETNHFSLGRARARICISASLPPNANAKFRKIIFSPTRNVIRRDTKCYFITFLFCTSESARYNVSANYRKPGPARLHTPY
jgi:hypothetical protein